MDLPVPIPLLYVSSREIVYIHLSISRGEMFACARSDGLFRWKAATLPLDDYTIVTVPLFAVRHNHRRRHCHRCHRSACTNRLRGCSFIARE